MMTGEPRRIELLPVVPQEKEKEKNKPTRTVRLKLTLTESCDTTCPEFSYTELVKNATGEIKPCEHHGDPLREINTDDPFAGEEDVEHDKMLAIARSFEAKYGPKPGSKKKGRSERIQDLVDLGEGYDEADPFIDNTEAYDEIVPACLTTKFGGFYVNTGVLDFREISDSDDDIQTSHRKKKKTKRITSDDERSEVGPEVGKKKRGRKKKIFKEDGDKDGFKKKRKKWSLSSADGEKAMKKRKFDVNKIKRPKMKTTPTVAELIKQQAQTTTNGLDNKTATYNQSLSLLDLTEFDMGSLDPGMESVINSVLNESPEDGQSKSPHPEDAPKLPAALSDRLESSIAWIKKEAKDSAEGKCKFFNTAVNEVLLDIENRSRQLSSTTRQAIYAHLAAFLPCGKETLMKRAKKLRLDAQDYLLKEPIQRLKDEIVKVMPVQLELYAAECAERSQELGWEVASTESDDEERSNDKRKLPRKKLEWTPRLKFLVNDIVRIKMEVYELSKTRSQTAEEYLRAFLDAEIKPLWPQGWIQTRMIYKETRQTHGKWTIQVPIKPKKPTLVLNKPGAGESPQSLPAGLATSGTVELDSDAPLPGGLVISGTEPIWGKPGSSSVPEPSRTKMGPSSSPAYSGAQKKKAVCITGSTESTNVKKELKREEAPKPALSLALDSPSTAHLNTKSLPGTPASTSTPGPAAVRTLLDYASDSFLQGTKSKTGVLSMGTVLPESTSASFVSTPGMTRTKSALSLVSSSVSLSLTPATDSLRSISNLLNREQPSQAAQHQHLAEPQSASTTRSTPEPPAYPTTPPSTKPAINSSAEQYLSQYKETLQQQSQPYVTSRQSPSPSSSALSPVSTSKLPEVKQSSVWETQQMVARVPSTGTLAGLITHGTSVSTSLAGSGLPSSVVSSSGITPSKLPGAQTQVHQVSSSLSKPHAQVTSHGLSLSTPGRDQTLTSGQRSSHAQSFSAVSLSQQQQRSSPSYSGAANQQSSSHSHIIPGVQLKSSQGHSLLNSPGKVNAHSDVSVQTQRHSPNESMAASIQRSASVQGQIPRSGTPQGQKASSSMSVREGHSGTVGGSSSSGGGLKSNLGNNLTGTLSQKHGSNSGGVASQGHGMTAVQQRQQQQQQQQRQKQQQQQQPPKTVSPGGGYVSQRQLASPQASSGSCSSQGAGAKPQATNGSHGSHVSSSSGPLAHQVNLSHVLKVEKTAAAAREKQNKPPQVPSPSQVVYSSLTMAQILASSPSETSSLPQPTVSRSTPTAPFNPSALWRTADQVTKPSDLQPPAAFMSTMSMSRSSPPTTGIFRTPTTGIRMSDVPGETPPLGHSSAPMQISRSPETLMTPGGVPMFSHTSPVHPTTSTLTTSSPSLHHAHSPQSVVHGATPHHMLHPTVLPFGYSYTDPSPSQRRY